MRNGVGNRYKRKTEYGAGEKEEIRGKEIETTRMRQKDKNWTQNIEKLENLKTTLVLCYPRVYISVPY